MSAVAVAAGERRAERWNGWLLAGLAGGATPAARGLTYVFPILSFELALRFTKVSRRHYVSLVCCLFFLTPLLRRLIEFRTGAATASFVMVSPFLACLAGIAVYRHAWTGVLRPELRTWTYVWVAIAYGAIVGVLSKELVGLIQDVFG